MSDELPKVDPWENWKKDVKHDFGLREGGFTERKDVDRTDKIQARARPKPLVPYISDGDSD